MADKRIKDLTNTATEADLVSGNYFALDGSAGTKKLNSTTLLTKTAQNALAGNVAPAFDSTVTYQKGDRVAYNGKIYAFKTAHTGAWASGDVYDAGNSFFSMLGSASSIGITDANDAPIGSAIWCQSSNNIDNTPLDGAGPSHLSGNLLTFSQKANYSSQYVTQFFCTTTALLFVRFKKYGGTWTNWSKLANDSDISTLISTINTKTAQNLNMLGEASDLSLTDADNAPCGAVWCVQSNVSNLPSTYSGILFTYGRKANLTSQYVAQLYVQTNGKLFSRFRPYSGTWTNWIEYEAVGSSNEFLYMGTSAGLLHITDANNAPIGSIIWCQASDVTTNFPTDSHGDILSGNLFTLARNKSYDSQYVTQLYFTTMSKVYVRFKKYGGTWSSWNRLADESDLAVYAGLTDALNYPDLSMFQRVGVIGDSYASALVYNAQGSSEGTRYPISWPQILGRKTGCTWTNFTRGGLSTRSWLTDADYGLAKLESEDPCDLYVLVLGINDLAISNYLGSITDITSHESYTEYPDTFYGNYGKIFEQILEHAPAAKIIFSTMANNVQGDSSSSGAFNAAIIEIAEHYGVPVVKQYEDSFFKSTIYTAMYGAHPTKAGQAGMATAFERMICKCVASNLTYFNSFDGES